MYQSPPTPTTIKATRRTVLLAGITTAFAGTVGLPAIARADPTPEPPNPDLPPETQAQVDEAEQRTNDLFPGWTSANGWLAQSRLDPAGGIFDTPLFGLSATVTLHSGAPAEILGWVIEEFNRTVTPIHDGALTGYLTANQYDPAPVTNHASGTAVNIMPTMFPDGTLDTLTIPQINAIQTITKTVAPAITWGGTYDTPQPSHFEIALKPTDTRLQDIAATIGRQILIAAAA